jgi:nitroreductase
MDLRQAIGSRCSQRQFDTTWPVSDADVTRLLEAAIRAPSAGNLQPWFFYVVRDAEVRQRLSEAANGQGFVAQAPVVIVVCAEPERSAARYGDRGRQLYCLQDTASAITIIHLAAVAMDLGTCWVGAFNEELASEALGLTSALRPVAMIPVGKPARQVQPRQRRPLEEVSLFL